MIRIIIVEDDPLVAQLNAAYLSRIEGVQVTGVFSNGQAALEHLKKHSTELAVVDVYMPICNGIELLRQIRANGIQINLRIRKLQIVEEHAVEVIVVVLPGVGQNGVKIPAAFFDNGGQADDLRAGTHDDQQLELAVVFERNFHLYTFSKKVSGFLGSKGSLAHISVTKSSVWLRLIMLWV